MTLLQIIQEFCARTGLTQPTVVMSARDDTLTQLVGLANEIMEDLVRRHQWEALVREVVFTSLAGGDQGDIRVLADPGFLKVMNDTIYDRTRRLPVFGPRNAQEWQAIKALPMSGPFYQYRLRGDRLLFIPDMVAGHTMAFEYMSEACVIDSTGPTPVYKKYFTKDTDTFALNDTLLLKGLRWRWKSEKGLPYAEEFRAYEAAVAEAAGADGTKTALSMSEPYPAVRPGIFVPAGNWGINNPIP